MDVSLFALTLVVTFALFIALVVAFKRGWLIAPSRTEQEIEQLRLQVDWLTKERNQLLAEIVELRRESRAQLEELRSAKTTLEAELSALRQKMEGATDLVVLGIWPTSNLDILSERRALRQSGLRYRSLIGDEVTAAAILRELRHNDIGIIEIGAHGNIEKIFVNDLSLDAGWWYRALKNRNVQVAIFLACFSDQSVADAVSRAGVRHVIAAQGELSDNIAIQFAEHFYNLFAEGYPVRQAFNEACLALGNHDHADRFVLR